jgi:hypothetical protein
MDNMGGLRKLYYIDADDFVSLEQGEDDLYDLILEEESDINEIEFTQDTGKISENEEESDNGIIYNFEVSCRIPKCGPDNSNLFGEIREKRILILGIDNNENYWLAGSPGSYFKINISSSTGEVSQDMNARQLKISAPLTTGSVFITSPFEIIPS